jgi:MFS transporter, putative metabolite:H+ symporter
MAKLNERPEPVASPVNESLGTAAAPELNVPARLERLPLTRYQRGLFVIIATAWLFDSIDLAALTFILAPMSAEFSLTDTQAGLLASVSFIGMVVGASSAGALADRYGRRPVFATSMLVWGAASLLAALSWDLTSLLVARFFIGVGMGAEFPVAQSLLSEFIPAGSRGKYLGFLEGFWPLGFISCGALSLLIVPTLGWRALFVLMAMLSLYAFYLRRAVPESPRWYESKGRLQEAEEALEQFEGKVALATGKPLPPVDTSAAPPSATGTQVPIAELIGASYRRRTLMVWGLWLCVLLGYYGITTWQAKLLADNGMDVSGSIAFVLLMALWGIPGFFTASLLLERLGRKTVVISFILLSAVTAYIYGSQTSTVGLIAVGSAMQFCFFGMWSALYAYTPEVFATRFRATGCGTASAFGRIGAMIGPLIVPLAMARWNQGAAFAVLAVFMVLGATLVAVWGPETRAKPLEEVSE